MWKYKVVTFEHRIDTAHVAHDSAFEFDLNKLGSEGWEVIAIIPEPGANSLVATVVCKQEF